MKKNLDIRSRSIRTVSSSTYPTDSSITIGTYWLDSVKRGIPAGSILVQRMLSMFWSPTKEDSESMPNPTAWLRVLMRC